ncbi:ion transporter [Telmatospirillum sp.]|uniref:ion transporter n=1 Tax=Telmatospirillum sp. TaxID=2079197 RepID=UPI00283C096F|nr:ion transporter [Telmatospirillum sp.]MDR3435951.1 ion transporter [Telmatospirillum sp.]
MLGGEGHSDPWVKLVDYALVSLITINCVFSILESVEDLAIVHGHIFHAFDHFSVAVFSVEYVLRVWTAVEINQPRFRHSFWGRVRFVFTPMAIVDLVAIVPFYLGIFFEVDLRAMRVLRLLRVFKLTRYSQAMSIMIDVLRQEARSIGAMLFVFLVMLVFVSSVMYMLEHPRQPEVFSDIPSAMWWAVVTMTTLGYGDMVPATVAGRVLGACTAVFGVGMIALPAGVLASGFSEQLRRRREEYLESVDKAVQDGRVKPREKRRLEATRLALGLSSEEAARILEYGVKGGQMHCPHCGELIHRNPAP